MEIATLIPAYRVKFFVEAFNSVLRQSHLPKIIIISDDSPNSEITQIIENQKEKNNFLNTCGVEIVCVQGPKKLSSWANIRNVCDAWERRTEFVHILLDDDAIFPRFYENHIYNLSKNLTSLSISRRWIANHEGTVVGDLNVPSFIGECKQNIVKISSGKLYQSVVATRQNWLGELSNIIFSKELIDILLRQSVYNLPVYGMSDLVLCLEHGRSNDTFYINKHLGFFRQHQNQNTGNLNSLAFLGAHLSWIPISIAAQRLGFISVDEMENNKDHIRSVVKDRFSSSDKFKIHDLISENLPDGEFIKLWTKLIIKSDMDM